LVFAVTAYAGANIVAFQARLTGSVSDWKGTNGLASEARILAFQFALVRPGDTASIDDALDEIVKASPTSVGLWQMRAAYQTAFGVPFERVLPGFRMSALTGSHEGYYMAQRATFGLQHWSELPDEDRLTVVRDLVGSAPGNRPGDGPERYRNVFVAKSQGERADIRAAAIASGRASKRLLQVLAD
jgi:hypothetical protein